jgi:Tfp pilus assembly protein PilF
MKASGYIRTSLSALTLLSAQLICGPATAQLPSPTVTAESGRLALAERWLESELYEKAEILLEAAVEANPDSARAWTLLGRSRALDRRYRLAEAPLRRAAELAPDNLEVLLLLGSTLWENGALEEAERVLIEARSATGGDPMLAEHQLGSLWLWQGRFEPAAEALGRVARQRPEWHLVWLELARAHQGLGELESARREFRRYLLRVPDDLSAHYGLAAVLAALEEPDLAAEALRTFAALSARDRARNLETGRAQAGADHAIYLASTGRRTEAVAHLRSLPGSEPVLVTLARLLRQGGDLEGAIASLEQAVALDPSRADLRALLRDFYSEKSELR